MGDVLKKGNLSLKYPAKQRKLGGKVWKDKWVELVGPQKQAGDSPKMLIYDCFPSGGCKAQDAKCLALQRIRGLRLSHSKTQEYVCVVDQEEVRSAPATPNQGGGGNVTNAMELFANASTAVASTMTRTGRLSTTGTLLRQFSKASSNTTTSTWSIDSQDSGGSSGNGSNNKENIRVSPYLYFATWSYTELHAWMTEIRSALWPPDALQGASGGFDVSLMDKDEWQLPASFRDMYGLLMVDGPTMTLFNPHTGKRRFSWNILHFSRFQVSPTLSVQDRNHIVRAVTTKQHPLGEGEVWMFCKEAPSLVSTLERSLYEERTRIPRTASAASFLDPISGGGGGGGGTSPKPGLAHNPHVQHLQQQGQYKQQQLPTIRSVCFDASVVDTASTAQKHGGGGGFHLGPPSGIRIRTSRNSSVEKLRLRDSGFVAVTSSTESLKTHGFHDLPRGSKCPCRSNGFKGIIGGENGRILGAGDVEDDDRRASSMLNVSNSGKSHFHNHRLFLAEGPVSSSTSAGDDDDGTCRPHQHRRLSVCCVLARASTALPMYASLQDPRRPLTSHVSEVDLKPVALATCERRSGRSTDSGLKIS